MRSLGCFELRIVSVQFPVLRKKVQALKMVRRMASVGRFRKAQALSLSYNFEHWFGLGIEEIFQPDTEDECDAQKSRQRRVHKVAFKFRQQRRRKTRVLAEFTQSHALTQPQAP